MQLNRVQLFAPLAICFLCQAMYRAFSVAALAYTAREAFFGGLCATAVGALLILLFLQLGRVLAAHTAFEICTNIALVLLCVCLWLGAGQTVAQMLRFYQQIFGAGGGWLLVLCGAALCVHCTPHALVRCARLLIVCLVVGALCMVLGLIGQSDLQRLSAVPLTATGFSAAFWAQLCLLPEHLLLLACSAGDALAQKGSPCASSGEACAEVNGNHAETGDKNREIWRFLRGNTSFLWLPVLAFGVQFSAVLFTELLFGVQQAGVGGFEFLRSWALLNLSRYDGIIALLWLLLAFFRLRLLGFAAMQCAPAARAAGEGEGGRRVLNE